MSRQKVYPADKYYPEPATLMVWRWHWYIVGPLVIPLSTHLIGSLYLSPNLSIRPPNLLYRFPLWATHLVKALNKSLISAKETPALDWFKKFIKSWNQIYWPSVEIFLKCACMILKQYTECFKNRSVLIQVRKCDFVNCLNERDGTECPSIFIFRTNILFLHFLVAFWFTRCSI